tara:strand:- start:558 stop:809 length:252 start_codon:yes stop_codon:yes gene_type:complete
MASTFWTDQKTAITKQLSELRTAISAIVIGGVESYSIDDGQSRQQVTKQNIDYLHKLEIQYIAQLKAIDKHENPGTANVGVVY